MRSQVSLCFFRWAEVCLQEFAYVGHGGNGREYGVLRSARSWRPLTTEAERFWGLSQ